MLKTSTLRHVVTILIVIITYLKQESSAANASMVLARVTNFLWQQPVVAQLTLGETIASFVSPVAL